MPNETIRWWQKLNNNGFQTDWPSYRPLGRRDVVTQELGDEVLAYDLQSEKTHCLNAAAASVWALCDGETSVSDLAGQLEMPMPAVQLALAYLEEADLLERTTQNSPAVSRREILRKLALTAAAVPMISSIALPSPAAANSACPNTGATSVCYRTGQCPAQNIASDNTNCPAACNTAGCRGTCYAGSNGCAVTGGTVVTPNVTCLECAQTLCAAAQQCSWEAGP